MTLKRENQILKDALCIEQDRLWFARYDLKNAQERIKRLEELGKELRECADLIGTYDCGEIKTMDRAEAAVEAWDKEAKL